MAGSKGERTEGRMQNLVLKYVVILFSLSETALKTIIAVQGHNHAFVQTENEVRYLVDGVSVPIKEDLSETGKRSDHAVSGGTLKTYGSAIRFDPPSLHFKERPIGIPHLERVALYNTNNNKSIHLSSISGSTVHFHCSFFQDKVLSPLGNTTFDVVFLGREEGAAEGMLFLHTSEGSFRYQVKGLSIPSPYRVRPLIGVRVPLNSSFAPLIELHNPHGNMLQVTEMYSSGTDLHLELPSGETEGPRALWEIPPFETKAVMRAKFLARSENNHTGYIRIKTNTTSALLVLPIEIEVSSQPGLYCPHEIIDFGLNLSSDKPKSMELRLLNSGKKTIQIQSVVVTPVNEAVTVNFRPVKVPPGTINPTPIATVLFEPSKASASKQLNGRFLVKSKNSQYKVSVPYRCKILKGSLEYNISITRFATHLGVSPELRNLTVTNRFNMSVIIHNFTLAMEAQPYFLVHNFTPIVLEPNKSVTVLQLMLNPEAASTDFEINTQLILHTNISRVHVPLVCYNGRLRKFIPQFPDSNVMDFGTLAIGSSREMYFAVININPIELRLRSWGSNLTQSIVELLGVEEGNQTVINQRATAFTNMNKSLFLKPDHYAIFRVRIESPLSEGLIFAEAFVQTQYEQLVVPFQVRVAKGSLTSVPETIVFEDTFPGKISVQTLHIFSSFLHPLVIKEISAQPQDKRFYFEPFRKTEPVIQAQIGSVVGKISFDPQMGCEDNCYSSIPLSTKVGKQWLQGLSLTPSLASFDTSLVTRLYEKFRSTISAGAQTNLTLRLDAGELKGFLFPVQAVSTWPLLSVKKEIAFPLTQIGNVSVQEVLLVNPSTSPVLVQLVLAQHYPKSAEVPDLLPDRLFPFGGDLLEEMVSVFTFPAEKNSTSAAVNSSQSVERQRIFDLFGVKVHEQSLVHYLLPRGKLRVNVGFSPSNASFVSSVLFIRNNLTGLEVIPLTGRGATGHFKFGNRKPGSATPLSFDVSEKLYKDCEKMKTKKYTLPSFSVKRTFTAKNSGELPLFVLGFDINGLSCEGYGFKVFNCYPFELPANSSRKIEIAFTPDFTLSYVLRSLNIRTSLGATVIFNYTLMATIPPFLLAPCAAVISRPTWEPLLYYAAVSFMLFLLFCVLAAAFFEADRILKYCYLSMTTSVPADNVVFDKSKVFDLKNVNGKIDNGSSQLFSNKNVSNQSENSRWQSDDTAPLINGIQNSTVKLERPSNTASLNKHWSTSEMENGCVAAEIKSKKKASKKNNSDSSTIRSSLARFFSRSSQSPKSEPNISPSTKDEANKSERRNSTESNSAVKESSSSRERSASRDTHRDSRGEIKALRNKSPRGSSFSVEEETSSTTTESSNTDDLQDRAPRNSTSPNNGKSSKPTKKEKSSNSRGPNNFSTDDDDGEFETKTKSQRKSKTVEHRRSPLPDTLKETSLELPYKLKPVRNKPDRKHPPVLRKNSKISAHLVEAESSGRESPLPVWDPPSGGNPDDSLSEFASQTKIFALKTGHITEPPVSYRQAVAPIVQTQVLPDKMNNNLSSVVGSVSFENKKPESVSPTPIGTKPGYVKTITPPPTWEPPSNTDFFMDPICEGFIQTGFPRKDEEVSSLVQSFRSSTSSFLPEPSVFGPGWDSSSVGVDSVDTQRRTTQDTWPNFDHSVAYPESLWDSPFTATSQAPEQNNSSTLDSIAGELWPTSLWAPGSLSLAQQLPSAETKMNGTHTDTNQDSIGSGPATTAAELDRGLGFDPFQSINNIWSPHTPSSEGWTSSVFSSEQ